ncbi:hypothetical protein P7K49_027573, partial [Saguinus oedipus]
ESPEERPPLGLLRLRKPRREEPGKGCPEELPLALGVAALELQQKRLEAGPAASAAFGEGGG